MPVAPVDAVSRVRELLAGGVPQFPGDVAQCFPGNASPYVVDPRDIAAALADQPFKAALFGRLQARLAQLAADFRTHAVMLGGSVLDPGVPHPRDLDAVVFYSPRDHLAHDQVASTLVAAMGEARTQGLDLRFVPVDAAPHLLIQAACFFAGLYASDRQPGAARKGTLLLVEAAA